MVDSEDEESLVIGAKSKNNNKEKKNDFVL